MEDESRPRGEVESPCTRICQIHPRTRLCIGSHRTIEEIAAWSRLKNEARRRIRDDLPFRASAHAVRHADRD